MSRTLAEYDRLKRQQAKKKPDRKVLSREDRLALHRLRFEAHKKGALLAKGGRGGLPSSLVLKVFRRDGFKCKIHGDRGEDKNGGLTVHHKGGIVESDWLSKKGHKMEANNLVVLCSRGHDEIHEKARAEGKDSSQVRPSGDK